MKMEFADNRGYARFTDLPDFIQKRILEVRRARLQEKADPVLAAKRRWLKAKAERISK